MEQWKLKWIHTTQQTHCILKPQPASLAGLTQIEAAHQEGLLFARILSSCRCNPEGSCCSFSPVLFIKLLTHCGLCIVLYFGISVIRQTQKYSCTLFLSLCDTKPLRQLNMTMFPYTRTTEGEKPCCPWQKQSTLQPFCSVLMAELWVLSWLRFPHG